MAAKIELFRENVRRQAGLLGLRYLDVAEKAGICHTYLSRILHGKSDPTLPVCERIAAALDTSLEALLAEPPKAPPPIVVKSGAIHKMAPAANSQ